MVDKSSESDVPQPETSEDPSSSENSDEGLSKSALKIKTVTQETIIPKLPWLSRLISVAMLIIGTLVVGLLFYRVMAVFFVPLFIAAAMVVIFRPIHNWFYHKLGRRPRTAAVATTSLVMGIVLMPFVLVLVVAGTQFTAMISQVDLNDWTNAIQKARTQFGLSLPHAELFRRLDYLADHLTEPNEAEKEAERAEAKPRSLDADEVLSEIDEAKRLLNFLQENVRGPAAAEASAAIANERLDEFATVIRQDNILQRGQAVATNADVSAEAETTATSDETEQENVDEDTVVDEPLVLEPPSDPGSADEDANIESDAIESSEDSGSESDDEVSDLDDEGEESTDVLLDFQREEKFHRPAVVASASIRSWMNTLLGGSFRSQARLLANPSEADFANLLRRTRESLQPRLLNATSASGMFLVQVIVGMVILVIAIYFFLIDGPAMVQTLMRLSPLDDNYERKLLQQFDSTSRAVVLASVLSALVQGLLAAIAYWICGLQSVVLLFLLTTMMSLIPFLGAASVWIPCAVYLGAVDQRWGFAIGLGIWGALVVSTVDNFIKAYVLHGHSQLHPLLALLSVLGGVQVFGPIGILVGPMVVVFLQTLLEILNHELGRDHREEFDDENTESLTSPDG